MSLEGEAALTGSQYDRAVGQLKACAENVFEKQPGRSVFFGLVLDMERLEAWEFRRGEKRAWRSGLKSFELKPGSPGLRLLVGALSRSSVELGFLATPCPPEIFAGIYKGSVR